VLRQSFFYPADFSRLPEPERNGTRGDKAHDQFVYSEPVEHNEGSKQHVELGDERRDQHLDCSRDIHVHRCQRIDQP